MKITNIEETGCNDILRWAISNKVNLLEEPELISLINNETSYTVTFSNINFFELFRLTQLFRDKLRIIEEKEFIKEFDDNYLSSLFSGKFHLDKDGNFHLEGDIPISSLANRATQSFVNLALQMSGNSDIVQTGMIRLYLPMICRRFDVAIPIEFGAFLGTLENLDDLYRIFNENYPNTLSNEINNENSSIIRSIAYKFVRSTAIVRYTDKSEQLLKLIKYVPLSISSSNTKLYKIGQLGFRKYDSHLRANFGCSLFNRLDNDLWTQRTRQISLIDSKLKVDFAVQLPMQYMQMIENSFSSDILPISYGSSIQNIIENGLAFNGFKNLDDEELSEEEYQQLTNDIEAYHSRINEANQFALNVISLLLQDNIHNDENSTFALLPSMYATNAVFTIDLEKKDLYLNKFNDIVINSLFKEMIGLASSLSYDMAQTK